jgi:hypothetical protein
MQTPHAGVLRLFLRLHAIKKRESSMLSFKTLAKLFHLKQCNRGDASLGNFHLLFMNVRISWINFDLKLSILQKQNAVSIIFDLERAYDTPWIYWILKHLFDMGSKSKLPICIQIFYLKDNSKLTSWAKVLLPWRIHTVYRTIVHWIQETIQGEYWSFLPWFNKRN